MKKKISIKFISIFSILILLIIAIVVSTAISFVGMKSSIGNITDKIKIESDTMQGELKDVLIDVALKGTQDQMDAVSDAVRNYFRDAEIATRIISGDSNAKMVLESTINQSETINENNYAIQLKKALINAHDKSNGSLMFLYVGYEDAQIYTATGWETPDYDPRTRPWYQDAMKNKGKLIWTDPYIDFATGELIISAAKSIENNNGESVGVVGADIAMQSIQKLLEEYKIGETGYIFAADKEGIMFYHPTDAGKTDPDEFEKIGQPVSTDIAREYAQSNEKESKILRYEYKGDNKVAIASKVTDLNLSLFASYKLTEFDMVADDMAKGFDNLENEVQNVVNFNQKEILKNTMMMAAILLIILAFITALIVGKITNPIKLISENIKKLSEGKLNEIIMISTPTSEIDEAVKGLKLLQTEFSEMITNIVSLSNEIGKDSVELTKNGLELEEISEAVVLTVGEIAEGATNQAMDSEESSRLMQDLSTEINKLTDYNVEQVSETDKLDENTNNGVKAIEELNLKASQSSEIISETSNKTHELSEAIESITGITDTISSIAEQTNLLALNASIEAARAGEAGRGFSVVADEIRKLSEETASATSQITDMIITVKQTSVVVLKSMGSVEEINDEQIKASQNVSGTFNDIRNSLNNIVNMINESTSRIDDINNQKEMVFNKIQNIVAVTEETAAASEEVSASMETQNESVKTVSNLAEDLDKKVEELNESLSKFEL
ncbi:methyl-accepting chemotaxis protein [Clostridiaceae bacterium HSG29]|nr:methyl-accepting chemotaxis protein [Clostridiaceae bacterium HSG29]